MTKHGLKRALLAVIEDALDQRVIEPGELLEILADHVASRLEPGAGTADDRRLHHRLMQLTREKRTDANARIARRVPNPRDDGSLR